MLCFSIFGLLFVSVTAGTAAEQQKAFDKKELDAFCNELPQVLDSLQKNERSKYLIETMNDYRNTIFQREPDRTFPSTFTVKRFNYILNHIILAGIINDIKGFGDKKLIFLKEQQVRVRKDRKLSAEEKNKILHNLSASIEQVTRLNKQTKAIPYSELILLWDQKDTLNKMLLGVIPIKKQKMSSH
jgi:hypothetical protein